MKYVRRTTGYTWTDYKTNCKGVKNYTNYTSDWNTKEDGYNMEIECLKIDYPGYWNITGQLAEGIMVDLWRDFWIHETGMGQQVAQLYDRYMMMMMMSKNKMLS